MKRLLMICMAVCLLGCAQAGQNTPASDAEVMAPRMPIVTLPTQPVVVEPMPLVTEDDAGDTPAAPKPKEKTKKKSPKKEVAGDTADPAAEAWVSAGLETQEELPPTPETPTSAPVTSSGTATTTSASADPKPTDLTCPEGSVATGMTVFINDAGETVGFLSLHCHHVNDDGRLGEREQSPSLTLEVPATAHLHSRATSFSCLSKREDAIISGWTITADVIHDPNAFEGVRVGSLHKITIECKSLLADLYGEDLERADLAWTLDASTTPFVASPGQEIDTTRVGCFPYEAVVGVDLVAEGTTDTDARLGWIGRTCKRLKPEDIHPPIAHYSTGLFGGVREINSYGEWTGGGQEKLHCPSGSEAIGLFGTAGLEIDSVGMICKNPLTQQEFRTERRGGGGGGDFELRCLQYGQDIIRLRGARIVSGSWDDDRPERVVVKGLRIACEDVDIGGAIWWNDQFPGSKPDHDGAILHDNRIIVPPGHKITGLDLRTGKRVDAMGFLYERLPWHQITYFDRRPADAHTTGLGGGVGGGESRVDCPPLQVAVGLIAKTGADVDSIGLVCKDPAATDETALWFSPLVGGGGGGGAGDGGPHKILCPSELILQAVEVSPMHGMVGGLRIACIGIVKTDNPDRPWSILPGDVAAWYGEMNGHDLNELEQLEALTGDGHMTTKPILKPATYEIKHAITGLRIRSGDYVDAIGLFYHALE